ncbi:MAG: vitamin B12-dependent ribonucleotide reductase [Lachnospirales bacterium]
MSLKKLLTRYFTKELDKSNKNVFDLFDWKKVNVLLTNYSTGEVILDMQNLEFPVQYSQSACDIIASKYFRKKGVNNELGYESSMKEIVTRMTTFWVDALLDEKLIDENTKDIVFDELAYMLLDQMWAPNSPQWFNTGLSLYNIKGEKQGHFYYDKEQEKVVESNDSYTRTQGSACFIISINDSLMGDKSLTDQIKNETLLFKYGSGVGTNWSTIRGKDELLSGGGHSSGLLSFLKVSDANAGAIKSGGTTRRAAKMVVLNDNHPEIEAFIDFKAKEEDKVRALGKMGYSTSIDGEAYATVAGQNANNSIRLSNNFMNKISQDDDRYELVGRVDPTVNKFVNARYIWDKISTATWKCGDPGLQFDDTINQWHTCPAGEDGKLWANHNRINASNPCSEYMFLDDTACNLASINVMKFLRDDNTYDVEGYINAIKYVQLVLEATIHKGQFPTVDIARKSYMFRTTGIGLTNMGMLFMSLGLPYDSDEARNLGASLTTLMTGHSYYISSLMAQEVGAFEKYDINKEHMKKVIRNHARVGAYSEDDKKFEDLSYNAFVLDHNILQKLNFKNLSEQVKLSWDSAIKNGEKFGYRNAQVSVLAPTGTIAFAMDCASTSSEPFFSHIAFKKLVGGTYMEIVNPAIPRALKTLGYSEDEINEILNYVLAKDEDTGMIKDGKIEGAPHLKEEHLEVFDTANICGTGSRFIKPMAHVKMMAALTPCVTGAISKTVNLPKDATVDDIAEIHFESWKLGVKAIALYRDGCKASQPLNSRKESSEENSLKDLSYYELLDYAKNKEKNVALARRKPKGIRNAHVHEAAINGLKLYITTSFDERTKNLSEIYVSCGRQGSLTKGLLDSLSTTISKMLQYGVPAKDIAKMYRGQKYEPSGFVTGHPYIKSVDSISDLISKIIDIELGNYEYVQVKPENYDEKDIEEKKQEVLKGNYTFADIVHSESCPTCKSTKMVQNGTCKICTVCGTTTGCS